MVHYCVCHALNHEEHGSGSARPDLSAICKAPQKISPQNCRHISTLINDQIYPALQRGTNVANRSLFLKIFLCIQEKKRNPNATGKFSLRASDVFRSSPVCPDFAPISCNIISSFNTPLALPSSVYKNVNYWLTKQI